MDRTTRHYGNQVGQILERYGAVAWNDERQCQGKGYEHEPGDDHRRMSHQHTRIHAHIDVLGRVIIRAGRANSECGDRGGDRGDSSAAFRLLKRPPAEIASLSYYAEYYYAEYTKRETWLFGRPRNASDICSSPGTGREAGWQLHEALFQLWWGSAGRRNEASPPTFTRCSMILRASC